MITLAGEMQPLHSEARAENTGKITDDQDYELEREVWMNVINQNFILHNQL